MMIPVLVTMLLAASTLEQQAAGLPDSGLKSVELASEYSIRVPTDLVVTQAPVDLLPPGVRDYTFEATRALVRFSVTVKPYRVSEGSIPGQCVISQTLDSGILSGPIYCEGLTLRDSFSVGERIVKYGWVTEDRSMDCTMNTPCPLKVPFATRYRTTYVFMIPDKGRGNTIEFYTGDGARGPSQQVNQFAGTGKLLRDTVIPTLRKLR